MAQQKIEKGVQIFKQIREAIDGNAEDTETRLNEKADIADISDLGFSGDLKDSINNPAIQIEDQVFIKKANEWIAKLLNTDEQQNSSDIDGGSGTTSDALNTLESAKLDKLALSPQTVASEVEFLQEITVPPSSLILGVDGARLSSSGRALLFRDAFRENCFYPFYFVDDTDNVRPIWPSPGDIIEATVNPDLGITLSDPQEMAFPTSVGNTLTKAFIIRPMTAGILMVETWTGADDTGALVVKNKFEVLPGDIGNELTLMLPNPLMLFLSDSIFTRFSGVQLDGAVQSSGPFMGELKPFLRSSVHILTLKSLLIEGADVDVVKIFGSASIATEQNPLGLDIPLQIEFGPAQNDLNDDAMMNANGTITINVAGSYQLSAVGHLGRDGTPGEAHLRFSKFINGVQEGPTIGYAIDSSKFITEAVDDSIRHYEAGDVIEYFIARDSSGVDAGGMFLQDVNIPGWAPSATAVVSVRRVTIIQK